jgi:hypothetical protein
MQTIKINELSIDIYDGPVGISLSGGADSSLLFYILMKHAPGPVYVFSCGNGNTNNHEPASAIRVINYCIKQFNRTDVYFHAHWVKEKTIANMFAKDVIKSCNLSMLYNGFTRPPPRGAIVDYDQEGPIAVGGVDHEQTLPMYWTRDNNDLIRKIFGVNAGGEKPMHTPFINFNKQALAQAYFKLGIQELYSITRSCESLTLTSGHCGKCWWCKERIWGFGYLE